MRYIRQSYRINIFLISLKYQQKLPPHRLTDSHTFSKVLRNFNVLGLGERYQEEC